MRIVAQFDPSLTLSGQFTTEMPNNSGRMVVYNESNISIQLQWGGFTTYCPAWTAMLYCVQSNSPQVNWSQLLSLPVSGGAPVSQVIVEVFADGEAILGTYPSALVRSTNIGNAVPLSTAATSVSNDGNVSNTSVVEGTVSGQGSSSLQIFNQGFASLGNASLPGQLRIISQAPNSGAYSDVLELGNGSQLGIFGSASVDMQILSNGIIALKIGGVQIGHIGSGGITLDAGILGLLTGSLSRIAKAGPYSVTQTATFFNHGLSVVPDFIIPLLANQSGGGVFSCNVDIDNATSTQVKLSSNSVSGIKVYILSLKF